jgi:hypothetical protein
MVPRLVRRRYHETPWTASTFVLPVGASSPKRLEGYLTDSLVARDRWYLGPRIEYSREGKFFALVSALCILPHLKSVLSNLALGTYL